MVGSPWTVGGRILAAAFVMTAATIPGGWATGRWISAFGMTAEASPMILGAVQEEETPTVVAIDGLPDGLAPAVGAVLSQQGYRVDLAAGDVELWLRAELPLEGDEIGGLGVEYGDITASALVGVLRLPSVWIDYRDTEMGPGLFTLRYFVQPVSSHHMGVSEYRDFLILCPAESDVDPTVLFEEEQLLELGGEASGRTHPGVIALFPLEPTGADPDFLGADPDFLGADPDFLGADPDFLGADIVRNELDQWTLSTQVGGRRIGLVVEGIGRLP